MENPQLDKPGAGLPFPENLIVRYWVAPFQSRKADKTKNLKLFALLGARLMKEAGAVPADKRDEKVLVPRMRGIEDSSRHWSANEVLEHVMITGESMRALVETLAKGGSSDYVVDVANFKPKGKYAGADARPDFERFVAETLKRLEELPIADAGPTHLHPWMGRFNALQWTWLLAGHSGIHLAQLKAIRGGLANG